MPYNPYENADEETIMANLVASRQANEADRYRAALQQMKMQMLLQRMAQQQQAQEQRALWNQIRLNRWLSPGVDQPQKSQGPRQLGPEGREVLRQRLLEYGARPVEVNDIINQFLQRDDTGIPPEVRRAFSHAKIRPLKMDARAKSDLIAALKFPKNKKGGGLGYAHPEAQQLIERYNASGGDPAVFNEEERAVPAIARNIEFMKRYRPKLPEPRSQEAYVYSQQGGAPRREVYAGGTMGSQEVPRDDRAAIRRWYTQKQDWQPAYERFQDPNVFRRGEPTSELKATMRKQRQEDLRKRAMRWDPSALKEILTTQGTWWPEIKGTIERALSRLGMHMRGEYPLWPDESWGTYGYPSEPERNSPYSPENWRRYIASMFE